MQKIWFQILTVASEIKTTRNLLHLLYYFVIHICALESEQEYFFQSD